MTTLTLQTDEENYEPNIDNLDADQMQLIIEAAHKILERAAPIAQKMYDINPNTYARGSIDKISINDEDGPYIYAEWSEWSSCGCNDEGSFEIPISYLTDSDWLDKEHARIEAEKERARKAKEAREERERIAREKKKEEKDREEYARLKAKFEGAS